MRLAESLSKDKHEVIVIEKEESRAEHLGEKLASIVFYGDASDKDMLKKANVEKCQAVFAVTGNDKLNTIICENARTLGVRKLVARLNDPNREYPSGTRIRKTGRLDGKCDRFPLPFRTSGNKPSLDFCGESGSLWRR